MKSCPACTSTRLAVGPASRRSSRKVVGCRSCGAHFLAEQPESPAVFTLEEMPLSYFENWVDLKREGMGPDVWRTQLRWLADELASVEKPRLYDIGAGDGEFLGLARDEFGFDVAGNDIVEGAVLLAKERYGIDLDLGDLSVLGHQDEMDAVTLWCVLAHVPDGEQLISDVARLLKPGGLVFVQTPHYTVADRAFFGVKGATRGRITRLADRRLAQHHRILHTRRSITALLERFGFVDIEVQPQARYSLSSRAYLQSLRVPDRALGPASRAMDRLVSGPCAPRIVLDVRARKG